MVRDLLGAVVGFAVFIIVIIAILMDDECKGG